MRKGKQHKFIRSNFFFNNKTIKLNIKLKGRTERDREALFDSQFASEARKYTEREQCSTSGKM